MGHTADIDAFPDTGNTQGGGVTEHKHFLFLRFRTPRLLVLDEPTAGVDPLGSRDIRNIIENLKGRGMTVFLCSHLLEQVQEVCDRVGVIFKGLLIAEGSVNELTREGVLPRRQVRVGRNGQIKIAIGGHGPVDDFFRI